MKIKRINTRRNSDAPHWWQLVWEWEDILSTYLHAPLVGPKKINRDYQHIPSKFARKFPRIANLLCPNGLELRYEMIPKCYGYLLNAKHIIPCIIDYYLADDEINNMVDYYRKCPIILISSKEVYNHLMEYEYIFKNKGLKLAHWALSISDQYKLCQSPKEYDIGVFGRTNSVLMEYMSIYHNSHPGLSYIVRSSKEEDYAFVDNMGHILGRIEDRTEYISLMRKVKVALYSTPGIDGGESWCHGFSQVTPRFLEHIASGNHIIARYANNADTDYYELENFCSSIQTYDQFETAMDFALSNEIDVAKYKNYLSKHYTSVRAVELQQIIESLG